VRGDGKMKQQIVKRRSPLKRKIEAETTTDDLIEKCVKKGLIEKTEYGYIFKPEFFETLEIYEDE